MALNSIKKRYLAYGLTATSAILIVSTFFISSLSNKKNNVTAAFIPPYDTSCTAGTNNTYDIGPGEPYTTLGSFTWGGLQPGDMVRIHYQPGGYHEHIILSASGTAQNHVTICGVPGPQGQLPTIDESNATVSSQFNNSAYYATNILQGIGDLVVSMGPNSTDVDGLGKWESFQPQYIDIKNLNLTSSDGTDAYTDSSGNPQDPSGMQGLYIWTGSDITVTNVDIHNTVGDGFFVNDGNRLSSYITLQGSRIYDNGIPGSYLFHNIYTEADHVLFQYNQIGPLAPGDLGSSLKDRSSGTVVRYNWIEGGGHLIDLVEAQNETSHASFPDYQDAYVYGNILVDGPNSHSGAVVHFGGDQGVPAVYRKTLHFYNNSVFVQSDQTGSSGDVAFYNIMFEMESGTTLDADNNIIYNTSYTPGATPSELSLTRNSDEDPDNLPITLNFGANWISPGWVDYYNGTTPPSYYSFNGLSNIITNSNNNPGWTSTTYSTLDPHLVSGSPAVGTADTTVNTFDSLTSVDNPVAMEYVMQMLGESRGNTQDLGAFAYDPTYSASSICLQIPNVPTYQLPSSSVALTNASNGQPIATYNNITPATNGKVSFSLSQADGTTIQSLQNSSTPINLTLTIPGYLPITVTNITQPLSACANASQAPVLGDFSSSGKISLSDLVTMIRAYNQVSDSTTQVVYNALGGKWPGLSDLVTLVRNYNNQ